MIGVGNDGLVAVFATDFDVCKPLGNDEFLLIGATFDVDNFVVVHEGTTDFNGIIDVAELSCAIACHNDGVRVVERIYSLGCNEAQQGDG